MPNQIYVGLDLGQAANYTAAVILERREDRGYDESQVQTIVTQPLGGLGFFGAAESRRAILKPNGSVTYVDELPPPTLLHYAVRHVERFRLGTKYPEIVRQVARMMEQPPLSGKARLIADATGVGRPVIDLFREHGGLHVVPVMITAGTSVSTDEWGFVHVPKRDLIGAVQVALQHGQLRWPSERKLRAVADLKRELQTFQYRITAAGHDQYGSWREGEQDDLVLALALAVWYADTHYSSGPYL